MQGGKSVVFLAEVAWALLLTKRLHCICTVYILLSTPRLFCWMQSSCKANDGGQVEQLHTMCLPGCCQSALAVPSPVQRGTTAPPHRHPLLPQATSQSAKGKVACQGTREPVCSCMRSAPYQLQMVTRVKATREPDSLGHQDQVGNPSGCVSRQSGTRLVLWGASGMHGDHLAGSI